MFTVDFCEKWDSTKNQDGFIKNYFRDKKVTSTKASNELVNKRSLNNEWKCNKKKKSDYKTIHDSSHNSSENILQSKMHVTESPNSELNCVKNKKKKNKFEYKNRKFSSLPLEQMQDTKHLNAETKTISKSADSVKHVELISTNSDSTSQKKKKKRIRNKTKNSAIPDDSLIKIEITSNTVFSDSSRRDSDLFQNNSDSNCLKMKKRKKKLKKKFKSSESESKLDQFFDETEPTGFEHFDNVSIEETNSDSNYLKNKKPKNIDKHSENDDCSAEPTTIEISRDLLLKKNNLLQNKAYQKLQAAKFRYLNEMLYTTTGKDSLSYFQQNTDEFLDYHVGYQSQVSKWPINPIDIIIQDLTHVNKQAIIADLGCGEAKIAEVFPKKTVYSFDLIALKECVTACDISNVPLLNSSVDIAVFCLSLMGTNWKEYLKESHRILKPGGMLKIVEIESRIENLQHFIKNIEKYGFSLINENVSHKMFVFLNFKRVDRNKKSSKTPEVTLKPCLYKKR